MDFLELETKSSPGQSKSMQPSNHSWCEETCAEKGWGGSLIVQFLWVLCKSLALKLTKPLLGLLNSPSHLPGTFHLIERLQFRLCYFKI